MRNLIGQIFNHLTVIQRVKDNSGHGKIWLCVCVCNKEIVLTTQKLVQGGTKSCGCKRKELIGMAQITHGLKKSPEYAVWNTMIQRCTNPKHGAYKRYGGRGISVCDRWVKFENFIVDIGRRPSDEHSIDRYPDNDGNYEPGNVRWATPKEQANNRRKRPRLISQKESCRRYYHKNKEAIKAKRKKVVEL